MVDIAEDEAVLVVMMWMTQDALPVENMPGIGCRQYKYLLAYYVFRGKLYILRVYDPRRGKL